LIGHDEERRLALLAQMRFAYCPVHWDLFDPDYSGESRARV